jgi:hypothetical protein
MLSTPAGVRLRAYQQLNSTFRMPSDGMVSKA